MNIFQIISVLALGYAVMPAAAGSFDEEISETSMFEKDLMGQVVEDMLTVCLNTDPKQKTIKLESAKCSAIEQIYKEKFKGGTLSDEGLKTFLTVDLVPLLRSFRDSFPRRTLRALGVCAAEMA